MCRGKLLLPIGKETIEWFCHDFLSVVDSPSLFTTAFSELLVESRWQEEEARKEGEASDNRSDDGESSLPGWLDEQALAQRNPGILIAIFMGRWVCELSREEMYETSEETESKRDNNHKLLQHFLTCLVSRVSMCQSSQAVKWIMRCFSFPVVQTCLLSRDQSKGIFNISSKILLEIRTLVKVIF